MKEEESKGQNGFTDLQGPADVLRHYPWDGEWLRRGRPLDILWRFHLGVSVENLWPRLSDTSTLNRRMGLPKMSFSEINGTLFGSTVNAGVKMEWQEVPWEWEYGRSIKAARIYTKGLAQYVRIYYIMETQPDNSLYLHVYFGWIPRNRWSRLLLRIGMKRIKTRYRAALLEIESEIRSNTVQKDKLPVFSDEPARAKLTVFFSQLIEQGMPRDVVDSLIRYIQTEPDHELYRIRPRKLARLWGMDEFPVIQTMLHATRGGLLTLTWDMVCPHCRGVRKELTHLWEIPKTGTCEACNIDFDTSGLNALEVTFHVHPDIRRVEATFFCSAEPAKKPHIKLQKTLRPDQTYFTRFVFADGCYRFRIQGQKSYNILRIEPGSGTEEIRWHDSSVDQNVNTGSFPVINMFNGSPKPLTYIIEEHAVDSVALRPYQLFNFQEFRDLFAREAVAYDVQLDVGVQNILFIDIVGSTELYKKEGDGKAFALVREYFRRTYDITVTFRGVIVKTIGDAVMLAFGSSVDAVGAALELAAYFNGSTPGMPLRVRISLNRGPCLAVRLNSNIDYFGQTVNLAAKLQDYADAGKIVMSDSFRGETRVHAFLASQHYKPRAIHGASIKGYGKITVWYLTPAKNHENN